MVKQLLGASTADSHSTQLFVVHCSVLEATRAAKHNQQMIEFGFFEGRKSFRCRGTTFRGSDAHVVAALKLTLREHSRERAGVAYGKAPVVASVCARRSGVDGLWVGEGLVGKVKRDTSVGRDGVLDSDGLAKAYIYQRAGGANLLAAALGFGDT